MLKYPRGLLAGPGDEIFVIEFIFKFNIKSSSSDIQDLYVVKTICEFFSDPIRVFKCLKEQLWHFSFHR